MKVQNISVSNYRALNNRQNNYQNNVFLNNNKLDSFSLSNQNKISFNGNIAQKAISNLDAQFYIQYARNIKEEIVDTRVYGYDVLECVQDVKKDAEATKVQAKRIYDEVIDFFRKGSDNDYSPITVDKEYVSTYVKFRKNPDKTITAEEFDEKGLILTRSTLGPDGLIVKECEPFDNEYSFYKYDGDGVLRKFGQDVKEKANGMVAEEVYKYDKNGELVACAQNCRFNNDGSKKAEFLYRFTNDFGLITYSENNSISADGVEKSDFESRYKKVVSTRSRSQKPRTELLSCAEKTVYDPRKGNSASKVYSYRLDGSTISEFKKNYSSDLNDNKYASLVLKFDEHECISNVMEKASMFDNGETSASKVIYYRDEEPVFRYTGYRETSSGEQDYRTLYQFSK